MSYSSITRKERSRRRGEEEATRKRGGRRIIEEECYTEFTITDKGEFPRPKELV